MHVIRRQLGHHKHRPKPPIHSQAAASAAWDRKENGPTLEGYQPKNLAAYTPFEQLEGEKVEGVAVVEFPLFEVARSGTTARPTGRSSITEQNGARYIGLLVEGGALSPGVAYGAD